MWVYAVGAYGGYYMAVGGYYMVVGGCSCLDVGVWRRVGVREEGGLG